VHSQNITNYFTYFYTTDVYFEKESVMTTCFCELCKLLTVVWIFLEALMSLYFNPVWPSYSSKVSTQWNTMLWLVHSVLSFFFMLYSPHPLLFLLFCSCIDDVYYYLLKAHFTCTINHCVAILQYYFCQSFQNFSQDTLCQELLTSWCVFSEKLCKSFSIAGRISFVISPALLENSAIFFF
jgi:hypothetical protein